jgi:hypothetical protein
MNQHAIIGCMMLLGLWSTSAVAQSTLGELLDAGGKKLSKEEVRTVLSGARVTGPSTTGAATEYTYKADGSFSGNLKTSADWATGVVGTWSVDESGKLCARWTLTKNSKGFDGCFFYFANRDQYYLSESDSNRASPVYKRTINK